MNMKKLLALLLALVLVLSLLPMTVWADDGDDTASWISEALAESAESEPEEPEADRHGEPIAAALDSVGAVSDDPAVIVGDVPKIQPINPGAAELLGTSSGSCGANGDNVTWRLRANGTLTISGSGDMANDLFGGSVPWRRYRDRITTVVIEPGVTSIGDYAFAYCRSLTDVTIPNSVTNIGVYAFLECSSIPSIELPNSVSTIGDGAFSNCTNLTGIKIPNSVTEIGGGVFEYCENLASISIPNGLTAIRNGSFYYCSNLQSVTIPNSVTTIGASAFSNCTSLTSVTLPNSVTAIGNGAFQNCANLTAITIPSGVTELGENAFQNCTRLSSITLPSGITAINDYLFAGCTSLTGVTIPNGVTEIWDGAFSGCTALRSITIPAAVTDLWVDAFAECANLTEITFAGSAPCISNGGSGIFAHVTATAYYPAGDPSWTESMFQNYGGAITWIPSGVVPQTLLKIVAQPTDASAAMGETVSVSFTAQGEGLTYAWYCKDTGVSAFTKADGFTSSTYSVTMSEAINGRQLYCVVTDRYGCRTTTETVTIRVRQILASGSCGAQGDNVTWVLDDLGVLTISGTGAMAGYEYDSAVPWSSYRSRITSVVIKPGVTSIGDYSFYFCSNMKSVTIPTGVTGIGNYAFCVCGNLTSIVLPSSLISIGYSSFSNCTSLQNITIPNGVTTIRNSAFSYCYNLTRVVLANNVTELENSAFEGCSSLTCITIPNSVTAIGNYAFNNCTGLTEITFEGNAPSFREVVSSSQYVIPNRPINVFSNVTATAYYPAGDPTWTEEVRQDYGGVITWVAVTPPAPGAIASVTATGSAGRITVEWAASANAKTYNLARQKEGTSTWTSIATGLTACAYADEAVEYGVEYRYRIRAYNNSGSSAAVNSGYAAASAAKPGAIASVTAVGDYGKITVSWGASEFAATYNLARQAKGTNSWTSVATGLTTRSFEDKTAIVGTEYRYRVRAYNSVGNSAAIDSDYAAATDPFVASGSCGANGDNLTWTLDVYGTLTISGQGDMEQFRSTGDRTNAPWDNDRGSITAIVIEPGVTSVGNYAFYNCYNLTSVTLPDGVNSIGNYAFYNGQSLQSITLMDGLTSIGERAFYNCYSLTSVTLPTGMTTIGDYAFSNCSNLTGITLPNSLTSIGYGAFNHCGSLTSITLPNSLTTIWNAAFSYCSKLTSITIPNGVTSIRDSVFSNCQSLQSITIPASVTSIGNEAFYNCDNLTSITIPARVSSIGRFAFSYCTGLTEIIFEGNAPTFDRYYTVFNNVIATAYYPEDDPTWTEEVRQDYGGIITWVAVAPPVPGAIASVTATGGVGKITVEWSPAEHAATYNLARQKKGTSTWASVATGLTSCSFEDTTAEYGVEYRYRVRAYNRAGKSAAKDSGYAVAAATKPGAIASITATSDAGKITVTWAASEYAATYNLARQKKGASTWTSVATGLTDLTYEDTTATVGVEYRYRVRAYNSYGHSAAADSDYAAATDPIVAFGSCGAQGDNLTWTLDVYGTLTISGQGDMEQFLRTGDRTNAPWYNDRESITAIVIEPGVTGVGDNAFYNCYNLTSVTLPTASIGDYAFYNCSSLQSITLMDGLTTIGNYAFYNCTGLTSVTLPDGVTSVGDYAFGYCNNLTSVTLPNSLTTIGSSAFYNCLNLMSIIIPNGVTTIGESTFYNCRSLTSVTLPANLTTIGNSAFYECRGLTSITIPNGVTSIGNATFAYCNNLTSVTLPNSLTTIGSSAFYNCLNLMSIIIPNGVTTIGESTFYNCRSLTSVTLPANLTTIGNSAFRGCIALTSITIPASLTSIGNSAFYACTSLTEITFEGSAPTIYNNVFYGVVATAYYPEDDPTWTEEVRRDYSGVITWGGVENPTPGAIASVTATGGAGGITVTWTASAYATSYNVARQKRGSNAWTSVATGLTDRSFEDTTAEAGTEYRYRVRAYNSSGSSAAKNSNYATANGISWIDEEEEEYWP